MLIEHPERFGLSQLHQLRGRVGRGAEESFCIPPGRRESGSSGAARHLHRTEDGFEIARADLRLRGMGDFSVSGKAEPRFRVADPLRDGRSTSELAPSPIASWLTTPS